MNDLQVLLRDLTDNDMELVMAWRSHPAVYKGFYNQQKPLQWQEHFNWWTTRHNWKRWIVQVNNGSWTRDVGWIGLSGLDNWLPDIGILVGETTLWGQKVGRQALALALDWLKNNGYEKARCSILHDNEASRRMFESIGFEYAGEARAGEAYFIVNLTKVLIRDSQ